MELARCKVCIVYFSNPSPADAVPGLLSWQVRQRDPAMLLRWKVSVLLLCFSSIKFNPQGEFM
jgi:hypothetical protein